MEEVGKGIRLLRFLAPECYEKARKSGHADSGLCHHRRPLSLSLPHFSAIIFFASRLVQHPICFVQGIISINMILLLRWDVKKTAFNQPRVLLMLPLPPPLCKSLAEKRSFFFSPSLFLSFLSHPANKLLRRAFFFSSSLSPSIRCKGKKEEV